MGHKTRERAVPPQGDPNACRICHPKRRYVAMDQLWGRATKVKVRPDGRVDVWVPPGLDLAGVAR